MQNILKLAALAALFSSTAAAQTIGVTMQNFDDNFQTLLRNGMSARAAEAGVSLQIEDAQRDVAKQLNQVNNFIAAGATKANGFVLIGDLAHTAALKRTASAKEALSANGCDFVTIVDEQQAAWSRTQAVDLVTNWLTAGTTPELIFANNDEMAIGAAQAMRNAGLDMEKVIIAGVDATADGLAAMQAGDMDVTVFQNAVAQAGGAVDAAVALAKGEAVDRVVNIPFELVTKANMADYGGRN